LEGKKMGKGVKSEIKLVLKEVFIIVSGKF
jgi:hypothetical protein